jgi:hypothetical protein
MMKVCSVPLSFITGLDYFSNSLPLVIGITEGSEGSFRKENRLPARFEVLFPLMQFDVSVGLQFKGTWCFMSGV